MKFNKKKKQAQSSHIIIIISVLCLFSFSIQYNFWNNNGRNFNGDLFFFRNLDKFQGYEKLRKSLNFQSINSLFINFVVIWLH